MKFNLGDEVHWARLEHREKQITCGDCLGKKFIRVIFADDQEVSIECGNCRAGYDPPRGTVTSYTYEPIVGLYTVTGVDEQLKDGKAVLEYRLGGWIAKEDDVYDSREAAQIRAKELIIERDTQEAQRIKQKEKDTRSWAWNASYHKKCIKDAEKQIIYHTEKLNQANLHVKEEKNS